MFSLTRILSTIATAGVLISGCGCAALHSIPPQTVVLNTVEKDTVAKETVIRVFLDQDGFLWPDKDRPSFNLKGIGNHALKLSTTNRESSYYTIEHRPRAEKIANDLRNELEGGKELVVLIHGFNNNYAEANHSFGLVRGQISRSHPRERVYLEVYWDGLYQQGMRGLARAFWFKASTYSQLGGVIGLRRLLNGLPAETPVRVITHSRGAAVVLGALGTPNIPTELMDGWSDDYSQMVRAGLAENLQSFADLRVGMIAPALADFDFEKINGNRLPAKSIVVGFNENDPVLRKWRFGQKFNATTLGYHESTYQKVAGMFPGQFEDVRYEGCKFHAFDRYLARPETIRLYERVFASEPAPGKK